MEGSVKNASQLLEVFEDVLFGALQRNLFAQPAIPGLLLRNLI